MLSRVGCLHRASHGPAHRLVRLLSILFSITLVISLFPVVGAAAPPTPTATPRATATKTSTPTPTAAPLLPIPLYPGAKPGGTPASPDLFMANLTTLAGTVFFYPEAHYYTVRATADKVTEFYAKNLPRVGWKVLHGDSQFDGDLLTTAWTRGEQLLCIVVTSTSDNNTGLILIVGLKAPVNGAPPGSEPIDADSAANVARIHSYPITGAGMTLGVWAADSTHLILPTTRDQAVAEVDCTTGATARVLSALGKNSKLGFASLALSADGGTLLVGGGDVDPALVDMKSGKIRQTLMKAKDCWLQDAAIAPDGKSAAISCLKDKSLRLFEARSGKPVANLPQDSVVNELHYTQDGKVLVSVSYQVVRLWDAATGKRLAEIGPLKERVVVSALSPDAGQLALGTNKELQIWDVAKRKLSKTVPVKNGVRHLAYSPTGELLGVGETGTVDLFETSGWKKLHSITWIDDEFAFSPDGKLLAAIDGDRVVIYGVMNDAGPAGSKLATPAEAQARLPLIEVPPTPAPLAVPDLPVYAGATLDEAAMAEMADAPWPAGWSDVAFGAYRTKEAGAGGIKKLCDFYKSKMLELKWQVYKEKVGEQACELGWSKGDRIAYITIQWQEKQAKEVVFVLLTARGNWSTAGW